VIKTEIPNAAADAADAMDVEMSIPSHVAGWSAEKRAKYAEYVTQQADARGPAMIREGDKVGLLNFLGGVVRIVRFIPDILAAI
jgi:hypothetical protein